MRQKGCFSLKKVEQLILEVNGESSIIEKQEKGNYLSYLVVDEGDPKINVLETLEKSEQWLHTSLQEEGYPDVSEIYYGEWTKEEGFYIKTYSETEGKEVYIDG